MRHALVNFLCCFIPFKSLRKRVRLYARIPIRKYINYAKSFSASKHPRIRYACGYRCINLVVIVDDKFVFKFPRDGNGWNIAKREKRVTDALRPISPIKIPEMEILDFNGVAVRKYEYIAGVNFRALDTATQNANTNKIAKQLAKFLYVVGNANPVEICDLKPNKNDVPSMMRGWTQNDLWDNFIMDPKTFDIKACIDWEGAVFGSYERFFHRGTENKKIKAALLREYMKLCQR